MVAYAPLDVFFTSAWILSISRTKIFVDNFWRVGTDAPGMKSLNSFWTSGSEMELNDHPADIIAHSSCSSKLALLRRRGTSSSRRRDHAA
jgi:hypothetical protein